MKKAWEEACAQLHNIARCGVVKSDYEAQLARQMGIRTTPAVVGYTIGGGVVRIQQFTPTGAAAYRCVRVLYLSVCVLHM
jgi:hypothetical protein